LLATKTASGGWNRAAWVGSPGPVIHAGPSDD